VLVNWYWVLMIAKPADTSRSCNCVIPAGLKKIVLALSATAAEPA
jgi:hypothetical protein